MAPKKETAESKPKRQMTPEQLEKLAVARAKANEVRTAMKEGREDAQVAALQAKMDVLKAKKKPPTKEEPTVPEETPEPTSVPTPDEETDPEKEDKVAKPEPPVEPKVEPTQCEAGPPVEKLKKKTKKKPIVIVQNSESDSDSDSESNVIYIKKSSRKKKETVEPPTPPPPTPRIINRPVNPFFGYNMGIASRNFQ